MESLAGTEPRVGWVRVRPNVRLTPRQRQRLHLALETPGHGLEIRLMPEGLPPTCWHPDPAAEWGR